MVSINESKAETLCVNGYGGVTTSASDVKEMEVDLECDVVEGNKWGYVGI